jgi:hypothetical protein
MKKILSGALLMLAFAISARAQVNFGVKGGVNYSQVNGYYFNNGSSVVGYEAGIFARFGSSVYLQPEVYLGSTGGNFSDANGYSGTVRFTNLNVPLLIGLKFGEDDLNFRIMGGPVFSYNISTNQTQTANFKYTYPDFSGYSNSTLGLQGGFGVDIGPITTDVRYEGGLSQVNESFKQRQSLWLLSVGFKFL